MDGVDKLKDLDTADIDSIVLYLYVAHSWVEGEAICTLHTIDVPWVENEVCWDIPAIGKEWKHYPVTSHDDSFNLMKGGDIGFEPIATSKMVATDQWQATKITETMKEYLHAPEKNNGVMIRSGAELQPHEFFSSEAEDSSLRPKLVFYTHGTGIISGKSDIEMNQTLKVEAAGRECRIYIKDSKAYTLSICSLLGRELFSYSGTESGWVDIPLTHLSGAVLVATLESDGKTSTTHFINR